MWCYVVWYVGGTVDIATVTVKSETPGGNKLEQKSACGGGSWGGHCVNEGFIDLIRAIVGQDVYEKFGRKYGHDEYDFRKEFEEAKRQVEVLDIDLVIVDLLLLMLHFLLLISFKAVLN